MLRGLYMSGTAMITLERRMSVLTNNITNADTTGYKDDIFVSRSFDDVLIERINDPAVMSMTREVGPLNYGVHVDELKLNHQSGALESTGRSTDLALAGENAYFTVMTPEGERYTRAGDFMISSQGYLLTNEGYPVLGENGPIMIGTDNFSVTDDGTVMIGEQTVDRLRIAAFQDQDGLRKVGGSLFENFTNQPMVASTATVKQGFIEGSNVDMNRAMVEMLNVRRAYETNQKIIQMTDGTLDLAVNRLGKV